MKANQVFRVMVLLMVLITMIPPGGSTTYTATVSWTASVGEDIISIALDETNSRVYVGTVNNKVLAYDYNGVQQWSSTLNGTITTGERVNQTISADNDQYIWAFSNHTAYLIHAATGVPVWNVTNTTDTGMIVAAAAAKTAPIYAYATRDKVYTFNATGGLIGAYEPHRSAADEWQDIAMDPAGSYEYGITNGVETEIYKPASFAGSTTCTAPGWNYTYRFTNPGNMDVARYQVVLDTVNQSLFEAAGNDPTKLEVYQSDGTTPLPFWIQNFTTTPISSTSAGPYNLRMWITLPSLAAGASYMVIMKVNPVRVDPLSNGYTTFKFFDHFDAATLNLTQWNITKIKATSGTNTISNSILSVSTNTVAGTWGYILDAIQQKGGLLSTENISVDFWNTSRAPSAGSGWFGVSDQWDTGVRHGGAGSGDGTTFYTTNAPAVTYYTTENDAFSNPGFTVDTQLGQWWQSVLNGTSGKAFTNGTLRAASAANIPSGSAMHVYLGGYGGGATVISDAVWVRNYTVNEPVLDTNYGGNSTLWTCQAWDPFTIFNYSVSKYLGPMTGGKMKLDSTGSWLALSNTTHEVNQQVTTGAFNTMYTYVSSSGAVTARLSPSSAGSFTIEGRGSGITDIIRLDGTRVGTYTTGGTINGVAMSGNGLYAAAVSTDGVDYIFSKASSSSWTLLYSSDSVSEGLATAITADGLRILTGRGSGLLMMYTIGQEAANYFTITVIKNAMPYIGVGITVEDGGVDGSSYVAFKTGTTDSLGTFSPKLDYGHYYRVTVGASESVKVFYTSSNLLNYYVTIAGGLPTAIDYSVTYNSTTNDIWLYFQNSTTTDSAEWTITRLSDNAQVVSYTCTSVMMPTFMAWNIPADFRNTTYMVTASVACGGGAATNTWMIYATNEAGGGGLGNLLPPGLDAGIKMGIGFILLLCIGGVFSYLSGPIGAFLTALSAGGLILMHVWPVDFFPTVVLCIVWAFLGVVGRAAPEV